ncbi:MAG: extracellular solute-binding protein, partial [Lachnospiraceae bacterium]|nr:extracellular solute-binding protein [Lachnospiraceae bacterium]
GALTDINELLEANGFDWSDLIDGLVDQVTVGDAKVAVPWGPSATSYYYNKTELAKHGLDDFPESWEELKVWAKAVYEATGKTALVLTGDGNNATNLIQSFGGSLQEADDPTKTNLDAESLVTFLKEMNDMVKAGYIKFSNDGENIDQTAFARGDVMAYNISCTNYDTLRVAIEAASTAAENPTPWFELGMSWNFGDGGYGQSTVAGCSLVVPENIPQLWKNAAGVFLSWLVTPENQLRWATFSSYLVIFESNITNETVMNGVYETLPEMKNIYDHILENYQMKPQTVHYDAAMKLVEEAWIAIFIEGYDFDDTWNNCVEEVENILAGN